MARTLVRALAFTFAVALAGIVIGAGCAAPAPEKRPDASSQRPEAPSPLGDCALCGKPIHERAIEWQQRNYHIACYDRVGPVCGVCRAVIRGPHVVLAEKLAYHERCLRDTPRCEGCGLPAEGERGGSSRWEDGRITCRTCRADAALEAPDARQALRAARETLADVLKLDLGSVETPVVLVGEQELHAHAGALAHAGLKALTEVEERGSVENARGERRYRIYALYGLPRAGLTGVLAHELFHVLQSEASAAPQEAALREGSANYVQVRVLRSRGEDVRARLIEEDSDQIYGGGLRRCEKLALDRGEAKALEMGIHAVHFPEGY
jgi:hypothetical protein